MVVIFTMYCNAKKIYTLLLRCSYMFVFVVNSGPNISLCNTNRLVFVIGMDVVFFEVGSEFLCIARRTSFFKMPYHGWGVSRGRSSILSWFHPRPVLLGFVVTRVSLGQVLFWHNFTIAPFSSSFWRLPLTEGQTCEAVSVIEEYLKKNCYVVFIVNNTRNVRIT